MNAPASLAGKKARCPHCQTVFVVGPGAAPGGGLTPLDVPEASWSDPRAAPSGGLTPLDTDDLFASLPPAPQLAAAPLPPAANPLGYTPSPHRFGSGGDAPNPYASPGMGVLPGGSGRPGVAPLKLMIPAIAMLLISVITIGSFAFQALNFALSPLPPEFVAGRGLQGDPETAILSYKIGAVGAAIFGVLINVGVIAGAVQMIRLRGWDTARGGAVAACVPCCSALCLNIPFGIWALIVLNQPDVKRMFQ